MGVFLFKTLIPMPKNKQVIAFYPGNFNVYIEFVTPKGNHHKGVHHRPYYTYADAQQAIKEALMQPDIIAAYSAQELIPVYE